MSDQKQTASDDDASKKPNSPKSGFHSGGKRSGQKPDTKAKGDEREKITHHPIYTVTKKTDPQITANKIGWANFILAVVVAGFTGYLLLMTVKSYDISHDALQEAKRANDHTISQDSITFRRTYRPYIFGENFAYLDQHSGKMIKDMNIVIFLTLNAPAFSLERKLSYYIRSNNVDSLYFFNPVDTNIITYPSDKTQYTMSTSRSVINHDFAVKIAPKKLIRKVEVIYTWLDQPSERYFFYLESEYNTITKDWELIQQRAN